MYNSVDTLPLLSVLSVGNKTTNNVFPSPSAGRVVIPFSLTKSTGWLSLSIHPFVPSSLANLLGIVRTWLSSNSNSGNGSKHRVRRNEWRTQRLFVKQTGSGFAFSSLRHDDNVCSFYGEILCKLWRRFSKAWKVFIITLIINKILWKVKCIL